MPPAAATAAAASVAAASLRRVVDDDLGAAPPERDARSRGRCRATPPVTSATLSFESPCLTPSGQRLACCRDRRSRAPTVRRDPLDQAASTLPGPSSTTRVDAERRERLHRLLPAHRRGHLLDQQVLDARRVLVRLRPRRWRPPARRARSPRRAPARPPAARPPAASARSGTARSPAAASRAWRRRPWPARIARSTASVCPAITICPPPLSSRRLTTSRAGAASRHDGRAPSSADSPMIAAIAPTPAGTASCMNLPRRCTSRTASRSRSAPAATSAEYSPSEWPATTTGRSRRAPRSTRSAAIDGRQDRRLGVRGQRQLLLGPLEASFDSEKPERVVGLVEDGARLGERVVQRAAHADLLGALPGKEERELDARSPHHLTARRAPGQAGAQRHHQQDVARP